MAKEPNNPIDQPAAKTREEEMAEWNESQSNSMLKAGSGGKRSGVLMIGAAVVACGFVYWLKHDNGETAAPEKKPMRSSRLSAVRSKTQHLSAKRRRSSQSPTMASLARLLTHRVQQLSVRLNRRA